MSNAIILCSGFGERMEPLSSSCHKCLLPIKGIPNLVHTIRSLNSSGIEEVYVVTRKVFKKQYMKVLKEYRVTATLVFLDSDKNFNNAITLKPLASILGDTYIIEGDQYIREFYSQQGDTSLFYVKSNRGIKEWGVGLDSANRVKKVYHENLYQLNCLAGISYIHPCDAPLLKYKIEKNDNTDIYWEELLDDYDRFYFKEFEVPEDSIFEFDSIEDLLNQELMTPEEIASLISETPVEKLNSLTNVNFLISSHGEKKVLRLPGKGTESFVDHHREKLVHQLLRESNLDITPTCYFYQEGKIKITDYLEGYEHSNPNISFVEDLMEILGRLHSTPIENSPDNPLFIDLVKETLDYEELYGDIIRYPNYPVVREKVIRMIKNYSTENYTLVHRDLVPENILVTSKDLKLIDWEYAGILSHYWDLSSFILEFEATYGENTGVREKVINSYNRFPVNKYHLLSWMVIVDFIWACWSLAKTSVGDDCYEYGLRRWENCQQNLKKLVEEYEYEEVSGR